MKNQQELIIILSVVLGILLFLFGVMVRYYKTEFQRSNQISETFRKGWEDCASNWNNTIEEMISRGTKILELINLNNILKLQNKKYSLICRKLYNENTNLKLEIEKINSGKLKKRVRKKNEEI